MQLAAPVEPYRKGCGALVGSRSQLAEVSKVFTQVCTFTNTAPAQASSLPRRAGSRVPARAVDRVHVAALARVRGWGVAVAAAAHTARRPATGRRAVVPVLVGAPALVNPLQTHVFEVLADAGAGVEPPVASWRSEVLDGWIDQVT